VVLLGVHTNMCVLGRPFGLRQLAKKKKGDSHQIWVVARVFDPLEPRHFESALAPTHSWYP